MAVPIAEPITQAIVVAVAPGYFPAALEALAVVVPALSGVESKIANAVVVEAIGVVDAGPTRRGPAALHVFCARGWRRTRTALVLRRTGSLVQAACFGHPFVAGQLVKASRTVSTVVATSCSATQRLADIVIPLGWQCHAVGIRPGNRRAPEVWQNCVTAAEPPILEVSVAHGQDRATVLVVQVEHILVVVASGFVARVQAVRPAIVLPRQRDALRTIIAAKQTFALLLVALVCAVWKVIATTITVNAGPIVTTPLPCGAGNWGRGAPGAAVP